MAKINYTVKWLSDILLTGFIYKYFTPYQLKFVQNTTMTYTVCLKKFPTFMSSNISLVTKHIYPRLSLFWRYLVGNEMACSNLRKNFIAAGDEKFQKWCFFQSKIFGFNWLKNNVFGISFIFFSYKMVS